MHNHRRHFLIQSARLAGLAALGSTFPATTFGSNSYPFRLGVASGSPLPNAIVLWTRIMPDPPFGVALPPLPLAVRWEIAEDEGFRRITAQGVAAALPELAHSVHVDVTGLQPDRWYWYRFMLRDAVSPVGRTRTAPAASVLPATLRLAVASCQHWEFGQYAAHRQIAAASPDLVAFLGDYIYEWGPYELAHPAEPRRSDESFTLADYRARYAQYKTDPNLQASHHAAPWIVTWDDHEVANDYGNDRDERLDPLFLARRAAAYQAFYEHMPLRLPSLPAGSNRYAFLRIHDRYDWGRLARFHVLDDRQYRSYHACSKNGEGGSRSGTHCIERLDPARTMLGRAQEAWLAEGFASSPARWNILAQQTLMAQASQVPVRYPGDGRFWNDGWDGYPVARQRLLRDIERYRPANPVVLSGDVHTFYAADLQPEFDLPASVANPVLATEFCGGSVTSSSRPQARTERTLADNRHLKFGRSDCRGFMLIELSAARTTTRFQRVDEVSRADSPASTLASFVVENGRAGVLQTG